MNPARWQKRNKDELGEIATHERAVTALLGERASGNNVDTLEKAANLSGHIAMLTGIRSDRTSRRLAAATWALVAATVALVVVTLLVRP